MPLTDAHQTLRAQYAPGIIMRGLGHDNDYRLQAVFTRWRATRRVTLSSPPSAPNPKDEADV